MGKLTRPEHQLEDLLTSDLFGSLSYVRADLGLEPILRLAITSDGCHPFQSLRILAPPAYQFWPPVEEAGCRFCEPDVMITLTNSSIGCLAPLVEVKFASGKSSLALDSNPLPTDQLAREWDNLVELARRESSQPYLIYVTPDY